MRRGFSILLIVLFGLGPLSMLVDGSEDASLPACCRRQGAHHCGMAMQMAAMARIIDPHPALSAPSTCPYYPGPVLAILIPPNALAVPVAAGQGEDVQRFNAIDRLTATNTLPSRSHAGRGPPTANLV
jgi:hypothetical protein